MKENFKAALDFVMAHECVFEHGHYGDYAHVITENVPGDRGGLTKFGIDQRSHPHINIAALDYLGASRLYRDGEWTRIRGDDLPAGYDLAVFDTAVNCGCATAARMLQRSLNLAQVAPLLAEDGFIGAKTIAACSQAGEEGLENMIGQRTDHYLELANANPRNQKFTQGWLNRARDVQTALNALNAGRMTEATA